MKLDDDKKDKDQYYPSEKKIQISIRVFRVETETKNFGFQF